MSETCIHIVPVHEGEYPNAEAKAKEIFDWFREHDMIEETLSDCTLDADGGYQCKPAIIGIYDSEKLSQSAAKVPNIFQKIYDSDFGKAYLKDKTIPNYLEQLILGNGLEIYHGKRKVFHPMSGMELHIICPECNYEFEEDFGFECITNWMEYKDDYPVCPQCGEKRHLVKYQINEQEGEWAFSNIGITLWNPFPYLSEVFLNEMKRMFETDIRFFEVLI
jgi:rubredoxin